MAETYTGEVTKVELRLFEPRDRNYQPHTVDKDAKLLVAMETENGPIWFWTPPALYSVASPPGMGSAVVIVLENDWIGKRPSQDPKVAGNYPEPKIEVGQRLTVRGRFKRDTRYGRQINYVQRHQ